MVTKSLRFDGISTENLFWFDLISEGFEIEQVYLKEMMELTILLTEIAWKVMQHAYNNRYSC